MALQYLWWIAAAILVGVEMMTGTFNLLIVALACVAGGIAAVAGLDVGWQWGVAAVVEVVGTLAVNRWKRSHMSKPRLSNNLDVGQRVSVLEWRDDGTAPTATVGMLLPAGAELRYTGALAALRLIQASAGATVNVSYYA